MKQAGAAGLSTEAPPAETGYETTIVCSRLPDMMQPNTIATVVLPNRLADLVLLDPGQGRIRTGGCNQILPSGPARREQAKSIPVYIYDIVYTSHDITTNLICSATDLSSSATDFSC